MLKDFTKLASRLTETSENIKYWPEIEFNQLDKEKLSSIPTVKYVNDHSLQIQIEGKNHTILPSQYILYAIYIKELALAVKDYLVLFESKKTNLSQNEIANQIKSNSLSYSDLNIDDYSKLLGPKIFTDKSLNLDSKSIVNGDNPSNYKLRGTVDFFGSIILKPINIPNASSSILGKFIYHLTEQLDTYNYLQNRFLKELPFLIKDKVLKSFCYHVISFLYSYDELNRLKNIIVKNGDSNFSSIKDVDISLTSIFKTSNKILASHDLMQGGAIRNFEAPLFMVNSEFYYLSTEWTNNGEGRLDLQSFIVLLNKYYPEFKIRNENGEFIFESSQKSFNTSDEKVSPLKKTENKIYYGSPGTGKSHKVNEELKPLDKKFYERITFHPEYDNASFVGGYRPISEKKEGEDNEEVKYKFVPQAFTNIYVAAWNDPANQYYLAIEEINRGNCAEIFGDIFQLLDRNSNYTVTPSSELKQHLDMQLGDEHIGIKNGLKLPSNLSLLATMNTSDQSLFPMDSAFKRRWDWEYTPICYDETDENKSFKYFVRIDKEITFNWLDFIKAVNTKIKQNDNLGMDKCIGNYFIKPEENEISLKEFVNKAIFYLWNDVFKDEDERDSIFPKGVFYEDFFPIEKNGKELVLKILKTDDFKGVLKDENNPVVQQ